MKKTTMTKLWKPLLALSAGVLLLQACKKTDSRAPGNLTVSTFAGDTISGYANAQGSAARFSYPYGLAFDASGNLYVADEDNNRIRKISTSGVVTTIAGKSYGFADNKDSLAQFRYPADVAVDGQGNVYVADRYNNRIRKITPDGNVTTIAGTGVAGFKNGQGDTAQFYYPTGIAVDASGNIYVADTYNQRIRKITPQRMVSTVAGKVYGFADNKDTLAKFRYPSDVVVDRSGNLFVTDQSNDRIRKITPDGMVSTVAGDGNYGLVDGDGTLAEFADPYQLTLDGSGNLYVADTYNNRIRKVTPSGVVSTIAGSGAYGYQNGKDLNARFRYPQGIAITPTGAIYVSDAYNACIRKIN